MLRASDNQTIRRQRRFQITEKKVIKQLSTTTQLQHEQHRMKITYSAQDRLEVTVAKENVQIEKENSIDKVPDFPSITTVASIFSHSPLNSVYHIRFIDDTRL